MKRYHISTSGNDDDAYREATLHASRLVSEAPEELSEVLLLVSTKNQEDWLARLFGDKIRGQVWLGVRDTRTGSTIKGITVRNFASYCFTKPAVVVVFGASIKTIQLVEGNDNVGAIVCIPWNDGDIDQWIRTHNPEELRGNENQDLYPAIDEVVKVALDELTTNVNTVTGIANPHDNSRAKTVALALNRYADALLPDQIEGYLVDSGWTGNYAKDFADLLRTLQRGKYFQGGKRTGLKAHFKRWQQKTNNNQ